MRVMVKVMMTSLWMLGHIIGVSLILCEKWT